MHARQMKAHSILLHELSPLLILLLLSPLSPPVLSFSSPPPPPTALAIVRVIARSRAARVPRRKGAFTRNDVKTSPRSACSQPALRRAYGKVFAAEDRGEENRARTTRHFVSRVSLFPSLLLFFLSFFLFFLSALKWTRVFQQSAPTPRMRATL